MQVELRRITKTFGTLKANDSIDLILRPGTIHAILGENGAGKSTLMKILSGFSCPSSGRISIDGEPVRFRSPADAMARGIGMLYQDPLDFSSMSVLDNFMTGQGDGDRRRQTLRLAEGCRRFGFALRPEAPVARLTIGERQQLELLRLLAIGMHLLILDEPTTGISGAQKQQLFDALQALARQGHGVVLVSHKLADVEALCDRVTVLRQGRVTGEMAVPFDAPSLLDRMFGTRPSPCPRQSAAPGPVVLQVEALTAMGGRVGLIDANCALQQGEMVALAGLEGSGQGVFLRVCAGLQRPLRGSVYLDGRRLPSGDGQAFRKAGGRYMPAARLEEGLIAEMTVVEHFAVQYGRGLWINRRAARRRAVEKIAQFQVRGTPHTPVGALSGGNQQRLLLAFLPEQPRLLLLENPTRGLDVASAGWVWGHLRSLCRQGATVVFAAAELDDVLTAADRILVFFNGRIVLDRNRSATDAAQLGRAIAGQT